jgi:alkylation response protein AidB-like acyl-CoA dehydrogenase
MSEYTYPIDDAQFVLQELVEFDQLCERAGHTDVNTELASVILTQAAKLGSEVLAPLNKIGDIQHPKLIDLKGQPAIQETAGFSDAYRQYREGGWASLTGDECYGGQNLPNVLGTAVNEIWQSANLAFALCPLLSQGAIEALTHHASDDLKEKFLEKMISGDWPGTMNLTESDAGTDLAAIKTKAVAQDDHYIITGQKIFITWGDHQMSDNIVHLVLARLPDAPAGVKGISLFIVPKFLLDEQGLPSQRNDVYSVSLEHKLGIHGSPTCVMSFGENTGAIGYLVGEEHKGLNYMFTMMNHARQGVGLQGLAVSEAAYQHALAYAKDRLQGTNKDGSRFSIIKFADVRRMLMQMKASTQAMRALCLVGAAQVDDGDMARVELMTPIIKGWVTELAQEVTYQGVQIHGGMGFIEETGAAQFYRDARILTIYEGTTGIQALDLVGRKTLVNKGESLALLLADISADYETFAALGAEFELSIAQYRRAITDAVNARQWLLDNADKEIAGSVSVNFMMLFGYLCGGWLMAKSAVKANARLKSGDAKQAQLKAKLVTSQFYCEHILVRTQSLYQSIIAGSNSIMALAEDDF